MERLIRPPRAEELPGLVALENACFSLPRSPGELERSLGNFLAAFDETGLLGYIDVTVVLDEGYIGNLAVAERARRQGVGQALLSALLEQGRAQHLRFLTLEYRRSNRAAARLYEKNGFIVRGERKNVFEKPREDAIIATFDY